MARISKYVPLPKEKSKEFFENVDWSRLCKFVEEEFKVPASSFTKTHDGHANFNVFWNKDLKEMCGIAEHAFENVYLESFSSSICQKKEYDAELYQKAVNEQNWDVTDEEIQTVYGEPELWFTADLRYRCHKGGTNGVEIFYAHYTEKNGWKIRLTSDHEKVISLE